MPSYFMVPRWVTIMSLSRPGREMLGKMTLCRLVKCVSALGEVNRGAQALETHHFMLYAWLIPPSVHPRGL